MDPRFWNLFDRVAAWHPPAAPALAGLGIRLASPFNRPLRAAVEIWEPTRCRIRVAHRRPLQNHVGSLHAGALVTAGESAAGLMLVRTFPFDRFRPLLMSLSATYLRQARAELFGEVAITLELLAALEERLRAGETARVELVTNLTELDGTAVARVETVWQVKPWSQVRARSRAA